MSKPMQYDDYLGMSDSLSFEEADRIYKLLIDNANTEDEDFAELWEDFVKVAARYANIRATWYMISRRERMETDDARTACHDSVISHLNAIWRCMKIHQPPECHLALYENERLGPYMARGARAG